MKGSLSDEDKANKDHVGADAVQCLVYTLRQPKTGKEGDAAKKTEEANLKLLKQFQWACPACSKHDMKALLESKPVAKAKAKGKGKAAAKPAVLEAAAAEAQALFN